jgi:4-amino-4-deoxy-L-arabinose transferase-like glycosyltransferase
MRWFKRVEMLLIILLSSWFCFYNIHNYSIGEGHPDELIHARVIQNMVHNGNYLNPVIDGSVYGGKPPFKMWLTAAVLNVFGESTFTYRVIDSIAGTLFLSIFFIFIRALSKSYLLPWISLITLLSCKALFADHGLRDATQDTALNLLMMLVLFMTIRISESSLPGNPTSSSFSIIMAGLLLGLAILTKSAGALCVIPVIFLYLLITANLRAVFVRKWRQILLFGLAGTTLPALYLLAKISSDHPDSVNIILYDEIVTRAMKGYHNSHDTFFYWHFLINEASAFPALTLILGVLWCSRKHIISEERISALAVAWTIGPIAFYSMSASKLPWYISFAFPGMALAIGIFLQDLAIKSRDILKRKGSLTNKFTSLMSLLLVVISTYALWSRLSATVSSIYGSSQMSLPHKVVQNFERNPIPGTNKIKVVEIEALPKTVTERASKLYLSPVSNTYLLSFKDIKKAKDIDPELIIFPYKYFEDVFRENPPLAYSKFRAKIGHIRPESLVLFFYSQRLLAGIDWPQISYTLDSLSANSQRFQPLYGFHPINSLNYSDGLKFVQPVAAHRVKPSLAQLHFGAEYSYEISVPAKTAPLRLMLSLDARPVGKFELIPSKRQTIKLHLPRHLFTAKFHKIEFTLLSSQETLSTQPPEGIAINRFTRKLNFE